MEKLPERVFFLLLMPMDTIIHILESLATAHLTDMELDGVMKMNLKLKKEILKTVTFCPLLHSFLNLSEQQKTWNMN